MVNSQGVSVQRVNECRRGKPPPGGGDMYVSGVRRIAPVCGDMYVSGGDMIARFLRCAPRPNRPVLTEACEICSREHGKVRYLLGKALLIARLLASLRLKSVFPHFMWSGQSFSLLLLDCLHSL